MVETLRWDGQILWVLDQRRLPFEVVYERCDTTVSVAESIRSMLVRGAPAIGVTAAFGMVIALKEGFRQKAKPIGQWMKDQAAVLNQTRPTAVNLTWATQKMLDLMDTTPESSLSREFETTAIRILEDDIDSCKKIGLYGSAYIPKKASILTHCNAGALATAGYGTALGVVRRAVEDGKSIRVFADETRPFLQGARLTCWELMADGIDVTLITDNMAAHLMARGEIDCVVVGADRIAANGDVANKIGTYSVALAAKAHNIPFIVAAPISTIDMNCPDGSQIPIEERDSDEVTHIGTIRIAPEGVNTRNPAFDVTPAGLISVIVTDAGAIEPDISDGIARLMSRFSAEPEAKLP